MSHTIGSAEIRKHTHTKRKLSRKPAAMASTWDWRSIVCFDAAHFLCAEHGQQLGGARPLSSLMAAKD